jgi:prephenate dehydrogenase
VVFFNNVAIIGVGLIGGSLARVMKAKNLAQSITGSGRSRENLEQALKLGVIDRIAQGSSYGVEDADLVILASPVGAFEKIVLEIGPSLKKGSILTDVGSVKGLLLKQIGQILPSDVHFVPAHPIAGREKSGVEESTEALFQGRRCILTPDDSTDKKALEAVRALWIEAGAEVSLMDAELHDKVFAAVSHLPHVAAFAMMCAVAELKTDGGNYLQYSGAGFRDFTRIAASSPEMWKDICIMNRQHLIPMIDGYLDCLNSFRREISAVDETGLEKRMRLSSDARKGLE